MQQRNILLRAWDGKQMFYSPSILEPHLLATWFDAHSKNNNHGKASVFMEWVCNSNGFNIFEGDILSNIADATIIVKWSDTDWCWVAKDVHDGTNYGPISYILDDNPDYKIVGNELQHPHFLTT